MVQVHKKLSIVLILLVLLMGCESEKISSQTTSFDYVGTPVAMPSSKPLIVPNAPKELIHLYFPERNKGDLYVGYIHHIKTHFETSKGVTNIRVQLQYRDGTIVTPGYLRPEGSLISMGCQALLFSRDSTGQASLDAVRTCQ